MEEKNPYLPVERKKRSKSKDLKKDDNPSGTKYLIVDHEPSEDESEKLHTPIIIDPTKTTVILRLEVLVSAEEPKPKLLPMLNDTMMELMEINKSIEIKSFKEDITMTVFEKLTDDNVGKYIKEFKDTAGKENNMYTVLFKVSWKIGTSIGSMFKDNNSLRALLKSYYSFLKEHKVGIGSVGDIGHIYLIDPQTFNVVSKEKSYNEEMKKWLAKSNDHRLDNLKKDIGNFPFVEFRLKHYDITTTIGKATKTMNISTIELKCLRKHSQTITTLLAQAMKDVDPKVWGFFLQHRAVKDKIPAYIAIVKRHYELANKRNKTMIFNMSRYLMNTKDSGGKSLHDKLMAIEEKNSMMAPEIEIINLEPSDSTWMITALSESIGNVEAQIKEVLKEFMKKELYLNAKGHNQIHSVMEHLRPAREGIILNLGQLGILDIDESTATIAPRATATKRYVHSAFPQGKNTWSNIVQNNSYSDRGYGDGGSYEGTVGSLRTLQEESLARIDECERKNMELEAKFTKERYELNQQVQTLIEQNKATSSENAELRVQVTATLQDRDKTAAELVAVKQQNVETAMLLREAASQLNEYRSEMSSTCEKNRLERLAGEKRHKDELEQISRVAVQQTIESMFNRNGERRQENVLEVNIANTIDGNNNESGHHTHIYPATPHGNKNIDRETTPMAMGNNAPPRHRGNHPGRSGGRTIIRGHDETTNNRPSSLQSMLHASQTMFTSIKETVMPPIDAPTPQRGNKSNDTSMDEDQYEDTMDVADVTTQDEMTYSEMTDPLDPPDLDGERL